MGLTPLHILIPYYKTVFSKDKISVKTKHGCQIWAANIWLMIRWQNREREIPVVLCYNLNITQLLPNPNQGALFEAAHCVQLSILAYQLVLAQQRVEI